MGMSPVALVCAYVWWPHLPAVDLLEGVLGLLLQRIAQQDRQLLDGLKRHLVGVVPGEEGRGGEGKHRVTQV